MPVAVAVRPPRRLATAAVLVAVCALAGCGGRDTDSEPAGPATPATTTPTAGTDRATQLLLAVCAETIRTVPDVPGPEASAADGRTYLRAVESAMSTLAPDLDRLATQDPTRRRVLTDLARRMRVVATVARRTTDGRAAPGTENDLASTIAVLNVAATREKLPQCGL